MKPVRPPPNAPRVLRTPGRDQATALRLEREAVEAVEAECVPAVIGATWSGVTLNPPIIETVARELIIAGSPALPYAATPDNLAVGRLLADFCPGCLVSWSFEWDRDQVGPFEGFQEPLTEINGTYGEVVAVTLPNYPEPPADFFNALAIGVLTISGQLFCGDDNIGEPQLLYYVVFGASGSSGSAP